MKVVVAVLLGIVLVLAWGLITQVETNRKQRSQITELTSKLGDRTTHVSLELPWVVYERMTTAKEIHNREQVWDAIHKKCETNDGIPLSEAELLADIRQSVAGVQTERQKCSDKSLANAKLPALSWREVESYTDRDACEIAAKLMFRNHPRPGHDISCEYVAERDRP